MKETELKLYLSTKREPGRKIVRDHRVHDGVDGIVDVGDQPRVNLVIQKGEEHPRKALKQMNIHNLKFST